MTGRRTGGALRALARHLRDRDFRRQWLLAGVHADAAPKARTVLAWEACPLLAERSVNLGELAYLPFNLDPTQRLCLVVLAQSVKPKRIFEFGTYDGSATSLLARMVPEAQIVTLDFPPEKLSQFQREQLALAGGVGARYRDEPQSVQARIIQLYGDSREIDLSPYFGTMDLVLVDGGHDYESVRADTENAVALLAEGGLVVWDDYSMDWPGVVKAVDELAASRRWDVIRLVPSGLAVYGIDPKGMRLPSQPNK